MFGPNNNPIWNFLGVLSGSIVILIVGLRQFPSKKGTASREENLKKAIIKFKSEKKELTGLLTKERELRGKVEGKFLNMKHTFEIIYNHYEIEFRKKKDPDMIQMLRDFKKLFDD